MTQLFVFREKLRSFYAKYDAFITPVIRFALGFLTFHLINGNLGYMARLNNVAVELALALVCCLLPYGVMAFLAGLVVLAHLSSASLEMTVVMLVFLLLILILYYGFQPEDSYLLLLTPILFHFKIPYVLPLLLGLSGGLASIVPVCCGTALFYMLQYMKQNAGLMAGDGSVELVQRYLQIVKSLLSNRLMAVMMATCAMGILVVYLIRRLSVSYAWAIAIVLGTLTQLGCVFLGDFLFDVSVPIGELLLGLLISLAVAAVYHFMVFAVDYSRTEYVQFEDDEYYYYVKAVPKIAVSAPDVKVQRIGRKGGRPAEHAQR